jgi:hypothetical protein
MELCDGDLVNERLARVKSSRYEAPTAMSGRRRCRCGVCTQCQQNARWDRIFQEKYADPDYYSRLPRWDSSLNW